MLSDRDPVCSFPTVLAEMLDLSIILVAMSRPHRLNVMTMETISDVRETFDRVEGDRSVRAVILTGAGRGLCTGLGSKSPGHGAPGTEGVVPIPRTLSAHEHVTSLDQRIHRLRKPVITAVQVTPRSGA